MAQDCCGAPSRRRRMASSRPARLSSPVCARLLLQALGEHALLRDVRQFANDPAPPPPSVKQHAHVGAAPGVALALAAQAHAKINGGVRFRAHAALEDVEDTLHGFALVGMGHFEKFGDGARAFAAVDAPEILAQPQVVVQYVVFPKDFVGVLRKYAIALLAPFQAQFFRAQAAVAGPRHPDNQRHQPQRAQAQPHFQHRGGLVHEGELPHDRILGHQRHQLPAVGILQRRPGGVEAAKGGFHAARVVAAGADGIRGAFVHLQRGEQIFAAHILQHAARSGGDDAAVRAQQADVAAVGEQLAAQGRLVQTTEQSPFARRRGDEYAGLAVDLPVAQQAFARERTLRAGRFRKIQALPVIAQGLAIGVNKAEPAQPQRLPGRAQAGRARRAFRGLVGKGERRALQSAELFLQEQGHLRAAAVHARTEVAKHLRLRLRVRRPIVGDDGEDHHEHDDRQQQRHQRVHAHLAHRAGHDAIASFAPRSFLFLL